MPAMSSRRENSAITGSDPRCFSSRPAPATCARGRRAPRRGTSDTPIDQQRTSRTLATQVTQSHVRTTGLVKRDVQDLVVAVVRRAVLVTAAGGQPQAAVRARLHG